MNGMLFLYFCAAQADAGTIEAGTTCRQTGFARRLQIFFKSPFQRYHHHTWKNC